MEFQNPDIVVQIPNPDLTEFRHPGRTEFQSPDLVELSNPDLAEFQNPDLVEFQNPDLAEFQNPDLASIHIYYLKQLFDIILGCFCDLWAPFCGFCGFVTMAMHICYVYVH